MDSESDFGGLSDASSDFAPEPKKVAPKKATAPKKAPAAKKAAAKPRKRAVDSNDEEDASMTGTADGTPPSKKQKTAPAKKVAPKKKKEEDDDEDDDVKGPQDYEVKEKYKTLNLREFILQRPDTHAGSMNPTDGDKPTWVIEEGTDEMVSRNFSHIPVLYKCIDEVLVNAADHYTKHPDKMTFLKVEFDRKANTITVHNNGPGIPIKKDEDTGTWNPELVFGHLMASSNFDDEMERITGGRNGVGAKIANIFSTEFKIETQDGKHLYKQTWTNNMSVMGTPKITAAKGEQYTKVIWKPDLQRFKIEEMDADFEALVHRRVVDMAATLGIATYWNKQKIKKPKNFQEYCNMYIKAIHKDDPEAEKKVELIYTTVNDYWQVGFACSDGNAQQISFVNNIATTSGGSHVDYVANQIVQKINEVVKKKNKAAKVGPAQIKNHLFLFVNAKIVNPEFDSQSKIRLVSKAAKFGSKCELPDAFLSKIIKSQVVNNILESATAKADKAATKTDGSKRRRIHNANLTDANKAGTKDGHKCTLILTEGLSAMGLALAGISAINDRDHYGVFPLRGKVLNVRDASHDQIMKNAEITAIKQILGLQHKKTYTSVNELRYGHLMIMTDQDHDGSHIKGLLINFLDSAFPSLLKIPNFLVEFITPIVKVYKGANLKKATQVKTFFTMPEYEYWKENEVTTGWKHKYYKGLGTSDGEDAKEYFNDLDKHLKEFDTINDDGRQLVQLAFDKKKADERKEWLRQYEPGTYIDHTVDKIAYPDFINRELILFSIADCARSIPSVVDGLKPGQRKIIFAAFKRNLKNEIKVAQLSGYVSEHTGYLHGEASLQGTIVNMAQIFPGANNVNLLEPNGNFGSRLAGGKDAASARYIFTALSQFTRKVLPEHDDRLLEYNMDDGLKIEPKWYCPVVPMILVNGAEGIGTGWSTSIPSYNPEDIVANLRRLMKGEEMVPMSPWYRGWGGQMERVSEHRFKFSGTIRQVDATTVEITELPIKVWTQPFKEKLEEIMKGEKTPSWIKDYVDYNSPTKVHFRITLTSEKEMQAALAEGLENRFKLTTMVNTTNLVAFDQEGRIKRYNSVEEIMQEFYSLRLRHYQMRKERLLVDLNAELQKLSFQAKFIKMVIESKIKLGNRKAKDVVQELHKLGFPSYSKKKEAEMAGELEPTVDDPREDPAGEEELAEGEIGVAGYDYLLKMSIGTLTKEKAERLMQQVAEKEAQVDELQRKTAKDLWEVDLEEFLAEFHRALEEDLRRELNQPKKKGGARGKAAVKGGRKKKADDDDSDFDAAPKKRAPAKKLTQAKLPFESVKKEDEEAPVKKAPGRTAATKKTIIDDDSDFDDDVLDMVAKAAPQEKITSKPKPPPKVESDDDDFSMVNAAPAKTKPAAKPASPVDDDEAFQTADDNAGDNSAEESDVWLEQASSKPAAKAKSVSTSSKAAKPAAKPRAAAAKKISVYDVDSDDDDLGDISSLVKGVNDDSAVVSPRKIFANGAKKPVSKVTAAAVTKKAPVKKSPVVPDDSDDELPLAPPPKKSTTALAKKAPVRKATKTIEVSEDEAGDNDSDDSLLGPSKPVAKKSAAAKKAVPTTKPPPVKKAARKIIDSDDEDVDMNDEVDRALSDSDEEMADAPPPSKKVAPAKKAAPVKKAAVPAKKPAVKSAPKKAMKKVVDSDDDLDEDDEEIVTKKVITPATTRGGRARKPVSYAIEKDSDEESEEASEAEESEEEVDDDEF